MIKFQGEISQDCKKWFLKREFKAYLILSCLLALLYAIANIVIALLWELIALLYLIIPIVAIICFSLPFRKFAVNRVPSIVSIEDNFIECENEKEYANNKLDDVKKVIDLGEWYIVKFYFPVNLRWVICQKDLIVEGTIEEFEQLFEGKIIRKHK
ncbi:MAG: hypothetical protein K2L67_01855 [Clostridia bacterium]|nr:hypothetical protein [Clostridia bacterium]